MNNGASQSSSTKCNYRARKGVSSPIGGLLHDGLLNGASADETTDKAALTACVDAHITPADEQTVARLMGLVTFTTSPAGATPTVLPQDLSALRESTVTGAADLLTRIVQQDCQSAVQAVAADKIPNGSAFALIVGQLIKGLQPSIQRAGTVMGLDIMKKMDSNVLFEATQPQNSAPTPSDPEAEARVRNFNSMLKSTGSNLEVTYVPEVSQFYRSSRDAIAPKVGRRLRFASTRAARSTAPKLSPVPETRYWMMPRSKSANRSNSNPPRARVSLWQHVQHFP